MMEDMEDTVAFVMIKTEFGAAEEVAAAVSTFNYENEEGHRRGVRWADVVTGCYDVIAAVRVSNPDELRQIVVEQIPGVPGVRNPDTMVVSGYFKDGEPQPLGYNGHP